MFRERGSRPSPSDRSPTCSPSSAVVTDVTSPDLRRCDSGLRSAKGQNPGQEGKAWDADGKPAARVFGMAATAREGLPTLRDVPAVFVGSSSEAAEHDRLIHEVLPKAGIEPIPRRSRSSFRPGEYGLGSLERIVQENFHTELRGLPTRTQPACTLAAAFISLLKSRTLRRVSGPVMSATERKLPSSP